MTAGQLAGEIGITSMGVRQHLSGLERDDLVETRVVRQDRGRPAHYFGLTKEAEHLFPVRYGQLAVELLEQMAEIDGPEKVDALLALRTERLEQAYNEEMAGQPLADRVRVLGEIRDREGYMAESHADGADGDEYVLVEHHCPIYEIAHRFPRVCQLEQDLFERTLDAGVRRDEHKILGDDRCRYLVRKRD
jgi:predicted ArsR family transcriptional regulator